MKFLPQRQSVWKDLLIAILALLSAGLLVFELTADLLAEDLLVLYTIDFVIACLFLIDFSYELLQAKNKRNYLRHNWYLLIASIPITGGMFQALRSIQLLRLLRIVRLYARIRRLSEVAESVAIKSTRYLFIAMFAAIVVFSAATAIYLLEADTNSQINTFFDAVWWSTVTATTVGYGDITPVTWQGKTVGMILMFFGIGLLGTIAGLVGNYFLKEDVSA
jgi:voltage-gated potassium channel